MAPAADSHSFSSQTVPLQYGPTDHAVLYYIISRQDHTNTSWIVQVEWQKSHGSLSEIVS